MKYQCFDPVKADKYLQTECYKKDDDIFWISHIPMSFRFRHRASPTFEMANESDLIPLVCKGWPGVLELRGTISKAEPVFPTFQLILIRGDTGTGKTELCRYVEYTLNHEEEFIKRIERYGTLDQTSIHEYLDLRRRIECIRVERGHLSAVGALTIPLAIHYREEDISKKIVGISSNIKSGFYDFLKIRLSTERSHYESRIPHIGSLLEDRETFTSVISMNLDAHLKEIEEVEKSRVGTLGTLVVIKKRDLARFQLPPDEEELEKINAGLMEALSELIFRGGITSALERFIEESNSKGRYPLIIMDDLSLLNRLNLRMVFDFLTGIAGRGHRCTVIIGMTRGVYLEEVASIRSDTLTPRMYEVNLSETERMADWLGPASTEQFVRRYLRLIRVPTCPKSCPEPHQNISIELFPFNENFIRRVSQFLPKTQFGHTPRGIVSMIYHVISSDLPPYEAIDTFLRNQNLADYEPFAGLSEETKQKFKEAALAAYWFGLITEYSYEMSTQIASAFNFPIEGLIVEESKVRIPLQFAIPKDLIPTTTTGDQEQLIRNLHNIERWFRDEPLDPETEGLIEDIFLGSLAAASGESVDSLSRMFGHSSYEPNAWIAWRYGKKPKVIITKRLEQVQIREPVLVLTDYNAKRNPELPACLMCDSEDYKLLIADSCLGSKVSTRFVQKHLWELRNLVETYQRLLDRHLENQLGIDVRKFLLGCSIFAFSVLQGKNVPDTKKELSTIARAFLELKWDDFEKMISGPVKKRIPNIDHVIEYLPLVREITRSFVLLRESVLDANILDAYLHSNRKQVYDSFKGANKSLPLSFKVENKDGKAVPLHSVIAALRSMIDQVTEQKFDPSTARSEIEEWSRIVAKCDEGLAETLSRVAEKILKCRRVGALKNISFISLEGKCRELQQEIPTEEQIREVGEALKHVGELKQPELGTEDAFLLRTSFDSIKGSTVISFLQKASKFVKDLRIETDRPSYTEAISRSIRDLHDKILQLSETLGE